MTFAQAARTARAAAGSPKDSSSAGASRSAPSSKMYPGFAPAGSGRPRAMAPRKPAIVCWLPGTPYVGP